MAAFLRDAAQGGVTDSPRLLIDFLEHEVLKAALLRHNRVPGDVLDLADNGLSLEIGELNAVGRDHGKIAIRQEEEIAGVIEDGGNIGGHKVLVFAQTNDGRRAVAGGDDLIGIVDCNHS